MSAEQDPVFTIGHSTHSIDVFVDLLREHHVTAVADVRSAPHSSFSPQFSKDALVHSLKSYGIAYVFLGRELGARSKDPSCYVDGRIQYSRLARTELFKCGLDRVIHGVNEHRIALMCAEKEPLECHRTLLVAQALAERGIEVEHILENGRVERHEYALLRLLDVVGLPQRDLFRNTEQLVAEAMARQEARIAYVNDELAGRAPGDRK